MSLALNIVNKKALHDFEILSTFESGIVLLGPEVKSIRAGAVNLKGNFVHEWKGELYVEGIHISPYPQAHGVILEPTRQRKLLLHTKEIAKILAHLHQKGNTCVVLSLQNKRALIKATIGLVRGKKLHDKRETLKRKDEERDTQRAIKNFR